LTYLVVGRVRGQHEVGVSADEYVRHTPPAEEKIWNAALSAPDASVVIGISYSSDRHRWSEAAAT